MKKLLAFTAALYSAVSLQAFASSIYVSPRGDDRGDGKKSSPLKTLEAARDKSRAMRKKPSDKIEIILADGVYFLPSTVEFGSSDSNLVIRAENKGAARLTGALKLPPFKPLKDKAILAKLPPEADPSKVFESDIRIAGVTNVGLQKIKSPEAGMFVWNGKFQTLARWPNKDFTGIAAVPKMPFRPGQKRFREPSLEFTYAADRPSRWINEPNPMANGFFARYWASCRIKIKSIDPKTKTLYQDGRKTRYGYSKTGLWYGYNLLCELDAPGEYYIDRKKRKVYFIPPEGNPVGEGEVTATGNLLDIRDTQKITIKGITIGNCRHSALVVRDSENINLVSSTVANTGIPAVDYKEVFNSRIAGCDVKHTVGAGIVVMNKKPDDLKHHNVIVENCHIHDFGMMEYAGTAAIRLRGCGMKITKCTIHNGPQTGIHLNTRESEVSYCEIHSVALLCGEAGVIYAGRDWTTVGNRITANYIHDVYNPRKQFNRGIMIDDGGASFIMTSNLFVRLPVGMSFSGIANVCENNVMVDCHPALRLCQKWEKPENYNPSHYTHQSMLDTFFKTPFREEPWATRYPWMAMIEDSIKNKTLRAPETRSVVRHNVAMCATDKEWIYHLPHSPYSPQTWVIEDNHHSPDPGFVNLKKGDYRLRKDSPAWKCGFKPLPPRSEIGCQNTPERVVWPVIHPLTINCTNLVLRAKYND